MGLEIRHIGYTAKIGMVYCCLKLLLKLIPQIHKKFLPKSQSQFPMALTIRPEVTAKFRLLRSCDPHHKHKCWIVNVSFGSLDSSQTGFG